MAKSLLFTDVGQKCLVRNFFITNMSFKAIRENKIVTKISEFLQCPAPKPVMFPYPSLGVGVIIVSQCHADSVQSVIYKH